MDDILNMDLQVERIPDKRIRRYQNLERKTDTV